MRKMGRKSTDKAKDCGYLKTCGQGLGKVRVSVENGFRSSLSLIICLFGRMEER